jgi:capsular polysaccharide export protein
MLRRKGEAPSERGKVLAVGRIAAHPFLSAFFPDAAVVTRRRRGDSIEQICVLADDPALQSARQMSADTGAALTLIEEGPLRSVGDAASGAPCMSVILDSRHRLNLLLTDQSWLTPELRTRAALLMDFMTREGLSRTNAGRDPELELQIAGDRPVVLVVDDAEEEDASSGPPAPPGSLGGLIRLARLEHPEACLALVRPGPGAKLTAADAALVDLVIDGQVDTAPLIKRAEAVYAAGGYLALEAILQGRAVTCTGGPVFGGLGLTRDLDFRSQRPALDREGLFAAIYLLLPRYADPHTSKPCTAEVGFERLAALRRHARRVAGDWIGLNIAPAKDRVLEDFLAGPCSNFLPRSPGPFTLPDAAKLAVWSSSPSRRTRLAESERPEVVVRIEDGFIRSVGLGAAFHQAGSLVLDSRGIHYDHRRPSDLDLLIEKATRDPVLLRRAHDLAAQIVELGLTKYNMPSAGLPIPPLSTGKRVVLAPGQVANDASVLSGGGGMDVGTFLRRVRAAEPDAHIIFRPHPDVVAGLRPGEHVDVEDGLADEIAQGGDIVEWLDHVDSVHVLTSLTGFEALLRNKPVTTHGWPFFAGRGLTRDLGPTPAPDRAQVSLDALIAGALILYPLYVHPVSRLPCSPEVFVSSLAEQRNGGDDVMSGSRYLRIVRQMLGRRSTRRY